MRSESDCESQRWVVVSTDLNRSERTIERTYEEGLELGEEVVETVERDTVDRGKGGDVEEGTTEEVGSSVGGGSSRD